ncbi:MAG: hypothetical protein HY392_05240 [Candidatus Diapherotrites archaeon]|nr:hypothetical protein [Candidatus Diapherotrites archaeon]
MIVTGNPCITAPLLAMEGKTGHVRAACARHGMNQAKGFARAAEGARVVNQQTGKVNNQCKCFFCQFVERKGSGAA